MSGISVKIGFMVVLFGASGMLHAAKYELKPELSNTAFDWSAPSSYQGTHTVGPSSEDIVYIPAGMTAKMTAGSANWTIVNGVSRIVPRDGAVFEVEVLDTYEGRALLDVPVTEFEAKNATDTGTLRKTGGGALELASYGNVVKSAQNRDYYLNVDVLEGDLYLCNKGVKTQEKFYYKDLYVAEGATLHAGVVGYAYCTVLNGTGFIDLDITGVEIDTDQRLIIEGTDYSCFSGWMTGPLRIDINAGRHDITCPTNTIKTICLGGTGVCGFTRLGADNKVPSSLGVGNFNMGGEAGLVYLGTEAETSEKTFWLSSKTFIDAGAHGGLTMKGKFDTSGETSLLRTFTVLGSNDNPCVISGTFPGKAGQTNVFYFIKKGTGTWRMAHHATRGSLGVFDVREGTLQFDSIAPKGEACSLGYATNLFEECVHGQYGSGVPVDYAMVLGDNGTEGTLEYTGTQAASNATRHIAVRTKGRFKSAGANFNLSDVYALGTGEKTLTLDGFANSVNGCMATGLSDGTDGGTLSVVKEGEGTWQLTGTNTFTGSVVSRGGTLLINNPNRNYKWYRFVVMENAYSCDRYDTTYSIGTNEVGEAKAISDDEKAHVQIVHLSLYDADGNDLVKDFEPKIPITQFAFEGGDARIMEPGEVAIGQLGTYTGYKEPSQSLSNLFAVIEYPATGKLSGSKGGVKKDNPSTWLPFVMRLHDDAPAVVRVDFQCGRNREGIGSYNGRNMTAFRLDASADGINWDEGLAMNPAVDVPEKFPRWDSDGSSKVPTNGIRKDKGTVLSRTAAENVEFARYAFSSVGAVNDGVLKVFGDPIEVSGLVVDASAPAGTISNFKLAASGTVDVRNAEFVDGAPLELPGDYSHLEGVGNLAKWGIALDGEYVASKVLGVKNGKLTVYKRGLRIIFR